MPDVSTSGWRVLRLVLSTTACLGLPGCEQLLDLPNNPRLAEEAPEGPSGSANDERSSEPRGTRDEPPGAEDDEPPVSSAPGVIDVPPSDEAGAVSAGDRGGGGGGARDAGELLPVEADAGAPAPVVDCGAGGALGPNGRCYVVVQTARSWTEARSVCNALGAGWDLAAVRSPAVTTFLAEIGAGEAWIGASDEEEEGTWLWVNERVPFWSGTGTDGNSVNGEYENWNSDEPNGRGNSNCARLVVPRADNSVIPDSTTWADLECFELLASVCEGPPL